MYERHCCSVSGVLEVLEGSVAGSAAQDAVGCASAAGSISFDCMPGAKVDVAARSETVVSCKDEHSR
jgi:hypothetical protein